MERVVENEYWLLRWLESHSIASVDNAREHLRARDTIDELKEVSARSAMALDEPAPGDFSILAAAGTDLSGRLTCRNPACRRREVDNLFRRAWHYFDSIIVDDAAARLLSQPPETILQNLDELLGQIDIALYLQKIGASSLVAFRVKASPCFQHWRKHASEVGLVRTPRVADKAIRQLVKRASVKVLDPGELNELKLTVPEGITPVSVRDRDFHHDMVLLVWGQEPSAITEAVRFAVAREVKVSLAYLTADLISAAQLRCPVGATLPLHRDFLTASCVSEAADQVAFALALPVLADVPIDTLIKIRADENDAFRRFRDALRAAAQDRLKAAGVRDPSIVAAEIRRDVIEPELRRIDARLRSISRGLAKKTASGITVGALATTCGLLAGVAPGLAVLAGITAMSGIAGTAASKNIEEREEVALSDFYFLWNAVPHLHEEEPLLSLRCTVKG